GSGGRVPSLASSRVCSAGVAGPADASQGKAGPSVASPVKAGAGIGGACPFETSGALAADAAWASHEKSGTSSSAEDVGFGGRGLRRAWGGGAGRRGLGGGGFVLVGSFGERSSRGGLPVYRHKLPAPRLEALRKRMERRVPCESLARSHHLADLNHQLLVGK